MKNNKRLIIIISVILIVIAIIAFIYIKKNSITFTLNGEEVVSIEYGQDYIDSGFVAKDGFGSDLHDNVTVNGEIDIYSAGPYEITYELNYKNNKHSLKRIVIVNDINVEDLELILNGEEETYLMVNSYYEEEGAYVLNKIENKKIEEDITIYNNVDSTRVGEYEVKYIYQYNGNAIEKTRNVTVFDISSSISPTTITSKKVDISFDLSNLKILKEIRLPDGSITSLKSVSYSVENNGDYLFTIYTTDNREFEKTVSITNIIGEYSCNGTINLTGTNLSLLGTKLEEVERFEWNINGKNEVGTRSIKKEKIVNSASVDLVFKNGEKKKITCSIKDNLVYHFKYDENNTKPFMKCRTYTEAERSNLEAKLKKAVATAGYGTRAGAVEAARFLVGALDYKVPYLGPKTVNTALGRYARVGLNIANSGGWGCNVSGWTQGMDCTNFVSWVYAQNGMKVSSYSTKNVYRTASDIANTKVGDLLLSSKDTRSCTEFIHVGIIIGIDDKYFYVAESTTGSVNAIVTNKYTKNGFTDRRKFDCVKHVEYPSNGNLTNMWLS